MALAEAFSTCAGTGVALRAGYRDGVDAGGVSVTGVELGIMIFRLGEEVLGDRC